MDFPLMEGEERAEGGGFLGKLGDESPRDRGLEGGEDMETGCAGGPRAVVLQQWKTADAAARETMLDTGKIQPEVP